MIGIEVVDPGLFTTVQDWPGRVGYWHVGVPPSGPMDDLSFRIGNRVLGNPEGAAGLECTKAGPVLRFSSPSWICVTGAAAPVTLDGAPVPQWQSVRVPAGGLLQIGAVAGPGMRCYVLIEGGIAEPELLGSVATFTQGGFGGHHGRTVRAGDGLTATGGDGTAPALTRAPDESQPAIGRHWELAVTEGPHAAPEFLTGADMTTLTRTDYTVHFNSDRTGVRLTGPKPRWARRDGGEAGLHPSNIHDTPYCVGTLDFTGDTPILLGPDGPSLGGFVCPVTVVRGDRWKLGQLAPGDTVRLVPVRAAHAPPLRSVGVQRRAALPVVARGDTDGDGGVLQRYTGKDGTAVTLRRAGDGGALIEYGPMTLDLALRARVQVLYDRLRQCELPAVTELTPGVRSLQIQFDPEQISCAEVIDQLADQRIDPLQLQEIALRSDAHRRGVLGPVVEIPAGHELLGRVDGAVGQEAVRRVGQEQMGEVEAVVVFDGVEEPSVAFDPAVGGIGGLERFRHVLLVFGVVLIPGLDHLVHDVDLGVAGVEALAHHVSCVTEQRVEVLADDVHLLAHR